MEKKDLKIIFMGTPEFAVAPLEALIENGWNIIAVITAQDKLQGRGRKPKSSPVKDCAVKHAIPVLQPPNLKSPDFIETLKSYEADLQVVVAFRMLPEVVWSMPPMGTFNLHASLLPDYRGAAPINWAIINGETKTGVTTFFLKHEIDTGSILFQEEVPILPEENLGDLYEKLMQTGSTLVVKTLEAIAKDEIQPKVQDEGKALNHAPKIFKETGEINWNQPAVAIHNLIRGLSPYPAAWCKINDKTCKVFKSEIIATDGTNKEPGSFKTDNKTYVHFQTGEGVLSILNLQMEGKKRMDVGDFLRGNSLTA
ncbi:methionyl-tRNA formyltransferase [Cyclobacterium qasimii]|uniref:Methionyl-tRNA formyltransferase n=2 Tax=Cyclobacterium qasimii TaxID=1350429 RepID=S7WQV0_9BACT|nr:methionyl-tRNA formyltransferase [Cyclobacterium qasimii]EPR69114.1 Methionyl-tRNA formyltransferase [Cyclobacterium qasimii M12-11B]GEO22511.1 methionyl-tRNA formyltransferase [Cyclobacterium qasimii]